MIWIKRRESDAAKLLFPDVSALLKIRSRSVDQYRECIERGLLACFSGSFFLLRLIDDFGQWGEEEKKKRQKDKSVSCIQGQLALGWVESLSLDGSTFFFQAAKNTRTDCFYSGQSTGWADTSGLEWHACFKLYWSVNISGHTIEWKEISSPRKKNVQFPQSGK